MLAKQQGSGSKFLWTKRSDCPKHVSNGTLAYSKGVEHGLIVSVSFKLINGYEYELDIQIEGNVCFRNVSLESNELEMLEGRRRFPFRDRC